MSLGRLSCAPGSDPDEVVRRVNELLRPLYLTFRPAANHRQVREVMGELVWDLVAVPSDERPRSEELPPAAAAYVFRPRDDVTALDLARLQVLLGLRLPTGPEITMALEDKGLLRHFEQV